MRETFHRRGTPNPQIRPMEKKNPLAFIMTKKKIVANNKGRHRPPERRGKKELPWNTKSRTK